MALKFKGKVWVFGDNLDVDKEIIPFREREMGLMKDGNFGKWVMTPVDPEFPKKVKKGDIMVVATKKTLKFTPLPDFLLEIMSAGGIEPYTDKLIAEGKI